jgi:hypothetical protein
MDSTITIVDVADLRFPARCALDPDDAARL